MDYTIVALPRDDQLKKLNKLKKFFYLNGFRYTNSKNSSSVHITLAQFSFKENFNIKKFEFLSQLAENQKNIYIDKYFVVNNIHDWVEKDPFFKEKYCFWCSQVAIYFSSQEMFDLSSFIVGNLMELKVDTTDNYVKNIKKIKWENLWKENYIWNHINICNYAKIEMWEIAKDMIQKTFDWEIIVDKIWVRDKSWNIIFTLKFWDKN